MPFIGKQSTSNSQITNYTTTVGSGGQTNFTVVIEGGDETHVYLNGVLLKETTDYTVSSTQVSLVSPAVENDIVEIKVFRSFALVDAVRASDGGTFSGDVTVPNLTLSSNVIKASDGGNTITLDTSDNVTIGGDLKVTNLKHASSSSNNLVLGSDGSTTITNGTLSAGTIGSVVTGQNKPYFYCESYNGDPSISSDTELTTWVEGTNGDPDSKFDTTTGRFTPGVAGIYLFGAMIFTEADPAIFGRVKIRYNNGSSNSDVYHEIQDDIGSINVTRMIYMNATGYASVIVQFHNSARTIRGSASQFWGMRIA
tara:strand:- start:15096 stop:16028 length:933 start_codon:yes stop_codon:yes gene_type:complete